MKTTKTDNITTKAPPTVPIIYNYGLLRRWTSRIVNLLGLFSRGLEGKQHSQVDNSGCPPTKMPILVLLTEQLTKRDTFMTTV
jgi:hypothetical protein